MAKYLDENGLLYFWQQIKTKFAGFAFSKVRITNDSTNTDLEADTISDMLTIVNGNDITLTPTANTDTVSISHTNSGVTAASKGDTTDQTPGFGGTFKVTSGTVNARGHLTAFADHTVTIPNAVAVANGSGGTGGSAGLMSAADKTRLDNLDGEYIELPDSPSSGDYLKYNGTTWIADEIPEGAAPSSTTPKMDGTASTGSETAFARGDHIHPTDTSRAPLNSPTFTGIPRVPSAGRTEESTRIADTEFVHGLWKQMAADGWTSSEREYAVGDYVVYQGLLYKCKEGHTSSSSTKPDTSYQYWDRAWIGIELQDLKNDKLDAPYYPTDGQFISYDESDGLWVTRSAVTSVRVQATSPVQSSTSTAQTSTLNTTISLANNYGDTKNPYAAKSPHYVLAGPSSGSSTAAPSFRALVADDIPSIPKSKISDFPDLANVYKYKGSVAAYADLPSTGLTAGDVYDVQSDGMNYAWTGTAWDALGMSFSITSISNAEIDAILAQ